MTEHFCLKYAEMFHKSRKLMELFFDKLSFVRVNKKKEKHLGKK